MKKKKKKPIGFLRIGIESESEGRDIDVYVHVLSIVPFILNKKTKQKTKIVLFFSPYESRYVSM